MIASRWRFTGDPGGAAEFCIGGRVGLGVPRTDVRAGRVDKLQIGT
jgi:hypothetical protein